MGSIKKAWRNTMPENNTISAATDEQIEQLRRLRESVCMEYGDGRVCLTGNRDAAFVFANDLFNLLPSLLLRLEMAEAENAARDARMKRLGAAAWIERECLEDQESRWVEFSVEWLKTEVKRLREEVK